MDGFAGAGIADVRNRRLGVMNFLNQVSGTYPEATSFASGRPAEQFFQVDQWVGSMRLFVKDYSQRHSLDYRSASNILAQYGHTNGIINDLIARQIGIDEHIACEASQIIVTAGCQEAIALCIRALCNDHRDILLVRSPTYIGVTGAAALYGVPLAPIVCDDPNDIPGALAIEVRRLRKVGKRPRALYIIPDFDNPTGTVLGIQARRQLLSQCAHDEIIILEDNPYGMFCYEGERQPTLSSIDRGGCTIYLGTYSKTLCPTLRVGFVVVPKQLLGSASNSDRLIEGISVAKSFITCNTSQFMQSLVGGVLLSEKGSLAGIIAPALNHYKHNLQAISGELQTTLGDYRDLLTWNRPAGGFFLTVNLPFPFGHEEATRCASEHKAIVLPLSFFALTNEHNNSVRLAFSNLSIAQIEVGIHGFAAFVKSRL